VSPQGPDHQRTFSLATGYSSSTIAQERNVKQYFPGWFAEKLLWHLKAGDAIHRRLVCGGEVLSLWQMVKAPLIQFRDKLTEE
jgi:hypothetical protein